MARGDWPLVGRDSDLTRAAAAVAETGTAGGGIVVAGPAGVGRSRLAREVQRRAEDDGRTCVGAVGSRTAAAVPFGALASLIPAGLADRAADHPLDVLREADRVVAAWTGAGSGTGRPLVVVDDADLLDPASAVLLHHLATGGPATVAVTVCDGRAPPDAITALWKEGHAERIDLRPLDLRAVEELLERVLDGPLDPVSLDRVCRMAGGRPLFLRELVTAALADSSLARRHGVWHWDGPLRPTRRLEDLLGARLGAVDARCRPVLEVVACGEPLPIGLVEALVGRRDLERAERAGLVTVAADRLDAPHGGGERAAAPVVHVVPPILGEVVRATMPRARWRDCCARLAQALLQNGPRLPGDLLRVATWQLEAGTPPDGRGVSFVAAARQALLQTEPALAERLARAGLDEGDPEAMAVLVEAVEKQGRHAEVVELLSSPPASAHRPEPALALARASNLYWGAGLTDDWRAIATAATAEAADGGDSSGGEVMAAGTWLLLFDSDLSECAAVARRVLTGSGAGDRAVLWAATAAVPALALMGRAEEALGVVRRGRAAADRLGSQHPWGPSEIGWGHVLSLLTAGRLVEARSLADAGYEAVSHGPPQLVAMWAGFRGLVAKQEGDLITALRSLGEAVAVSDDTDVYRFVPLWLAERGGAAATTGDVATARTALAEARQRTTVGANRVFEPWILLDAAWMEAAEGRLSRAAEQALAAADRAHHLGQDAFEVVVAFDVARLGRPELVVDRLAALARTVDSGLAPLCAQAARALAGRDGPTLLALAADFERLGARLWAAEAAAAAVSSLPGSGAATPRAAAVERASRLRDRCPHAATPLLRTATDPVLLTRREREIALLAAAGRTSPEIATALRISTRTVDNHLGRVYTKLGVSGRSGLVDIFGS